jgi:hypothetical protein
MAKIELELKDDIFERAKHHADAQQTTVPQLLAEIVERQMLATPDTRTTFGLFADEPELMDEVLTLIQEERNRMSLQLWEPDFYAASCFEF